MCVNHCLVFTIKEVCSFDRNASKWSGWQSPISWCGSAVWPSPASCDCDWNSLVFTVKDSGLAVKHLKENYGWLRAYKSHVKRKTNYLINFSNQWKWKKVQAI